MSGPSFSLNMKTYWTQRGASTGISFARTLSGVTSTCLTLHHLHGPGTDFRADIKCIRIKTTTRVQSLATDRSLFRGTKTRIRFTVRGIGAGNAALWRTRSDDLWIPAFSAGTVVNSVVFQFTCSREGRAAHLDSSPNNQVSMR